MPIIKLKNSVNERTTKCKARTTYFGVDAFTNRPFKGSSAAVVPLTRWREDEWLQNVAMEMNLSQTAFLVPNASGFDLRWFTPKAEVDLCGHATIAAATVLAVLGNLRDKASVAFSTRSGVLSAERHGNRIDLDFPALRATECDPPPGLLESLNVKAKCVARSGFDFVVEVESESVVRAVAPDFLKLMAVECRGVVVTARSDDPLLDFVSRFFAPAVGVPEDPATGSAHCILAPFWEPRLGKSKMIGHQVSQRGGIAFVGIRDERVSLSGDGVVFDCGDSEG